MSGIFFDEPSPAGIAAAIRRGLEAGWPKTGIEAVAQGFSERRFITRLREIAGGG